MALHRTARRIRSFAARLGTGAARSVRDLWRTHRDLLVDNAGYAATLAAAVAALVTQSDIADLLAALAAGVLAIYRTVRHDPTAR